LIQQNEFDAEERKEFRSEIISELKTIKEQVLKTNGRVTKLEEKQEYHVKECIACKKKLEPIIDAYDTGKKSFWTFGKIMSGIAFIAGLSLTIYSFFK
jgi:hypothetical protein